MSVPRGGRERRDKRPRCGAAVIAAIETEVGCFIARGVAGLPGGVAGFVVVAGVALARLVVIVIAGFLVGDIVAVAP